MFKKPIYLVICAVFLTSLWVTPNAFGGFADTLDKNANKMGRSVEKKTGHSSDSSKYQQYKFKSSKIRVQLPKSYKVTNKNKDGFSAQSSSQGISLSVKKMPFKGETDKTQIKMARKAADQAKAKGQIHLIENKKVNGIKGIQTWKLVKKGDRTGPRVYKWEGWSNKQGQHAIITANFASKKYDQYKGDFDTILNSIRWDADKSKAN